MTQIDITARYSREFFYQPTLSVTRHLLGSYLLRNTPDGICGGRIVEVEAYQGPRDLGAHSSSGKPTERTRIMYGDGGRAYVYLIYGMYWCFNVVTGPAGLPQAVLVRALEPTHGISQMRERLAAPEKAPVTGLCRGPGKLCKALGITGLEYGADLLGDQLFLVPGKRVPASRIGRSPRINIEYAGAYKLKPWRLFELGNPCLSGPARLNRPAAGDLS